jgi:hypothetical protein
VSFIAFLKGVDFMRLVWYTKSMKDISPKKVIHYYNEEHDETLCCHEVSGPRWYIGNSTEHKVNCKNFILQFKIKEYLRYRNI